MMHPSRVPLRPLLTGAVVIAAAFLAMRGFSAARGLRDQLDRTTLTHSIVVERVRSVAKLITSETTVRDVVIYENTRYGSRKRSLLVVTGRVLAGVNLDSAAADVRVDDVARRIIITLPPASILAIEVTDVRTYDERAGLWNPFRPADRDSIGRQVRRQLERAGHELSLTEHANRSARQLLETMFSVNGYTAEVRTRSAPVIRPPQG
ncbi:MAG: DUF4230 domain-containing protein [Gemmatimonadaceae bacterium]